MLYVRLLIWLLINCSLFYILNFGFRVSDSDVLPLGKILNPDNGIWKNAEQALKFKDKKIKLDGVNESVDIIFDDRLVPHIYASNLEDALFAQGYVEAYLRLWQMDFIQRAAGGRLSEILGEKTLKRDIRQRKLGILLGAEKSIECWKSNQGDIPIMESYIDGINAYIKKLKSAHKPIEFKLLNYAPEEWTTLHSALILKSMTSTLASYNEDIPATNTLKYLGQEKFSLLFPNNDPDQSPVVPSSVDYPFQNVPERVKPDTIDYFDRYFENLTVFKGMKGVGSNNWAVHPEKTASGNTLLCNDPHLNLTLPSIWLEMHIVTPEFNAYGVSIPGMPGIMIGFNEHIAWGNTNVGHDFTDYYTIDWVDYRKNAYWVDGAKVPVENRTEIINVKGGYSYKFDLKITEFGPVYAESKEEVDLALARDWIGHKKHKLDETSVFVNIMKSSNYAEFEQASNEFFAPAQNFLFADKENIALRVNGNLAIKYENEGRFIKKGDAAQNLNSSYVDRAQNPFVINPERQYLSSANQVSTSSEYPYPYHGSFEEYRGKRVNQLLEQKEKPDVEFMKSMQRDVYSLKAEKFLPVMLNHLNSDDFEEGHVRILESLTKWDKNYTAESTEAKYFHLWFSNFKNVYWQALYDSTASKSILYPEDFVLYKAISENDNPVAKIIGFDSLKLAEDLETSFNLMISSFEKDKIDENWGAFRPKSIDHLLEIPAFSYNNLELGGCGDVVNAISSGIGPSWRMIVEMGENPKASVVLPGGQSGDPSSPYYDDSMEKWINGEYHLIDLSDSKEKIESKKLCRIILETK